jgi:hypothetical protein
MPLFPASQGTPVPVSLSTTEIQARLRLHLLPEIGSVRLRKLVTAFGSASQAIAASASGWRALGMSRARSMAPCAGWTGPTSMS